MVFKLDNLTKLFQADEVLTKALNAISFEVNNGEFIAVMGPSGCGKSTLLNILGFLDSATSGNYFFNGINVANYSETQRTQMRKGKIGFIFQNFNLIDELTVYENIELPLIAMKINEKERKSRVNDVLNRLKIEGTRKNFPSRLSGGQQQRAAIARAVIMNPLLILADEPTGNLDSTNGQSVMDLLHEINSTGTTIIIVTHSLEHAEQTKRIIHMLDGCIVSESLKN